MTYSIISKPCYRPREGYELHRERFLLKLGVVPNVIVPVRGMSCILGLMTIYAAPTGYRPREGYELHPNAVGDNASQIISYRPREGYELHLNGAT